MGGEGSGGCMTLVFLFDLGFRFSSGISGRYRDCRRGRGGGGGLLIGDYVGFF